MLRLAQDDPHAATAALAPVLDESAPVGWRSWLVAAFLLEAIARDALGDQAAAGSAVERALDLAEPDGALSVSTSTVKTHLRNLYAKLGVHSRAEAVESARALGLLAPSARSR